MRAADNKEPLPPPSPPDFAEDTAVENLPRGYRRRCQQVPMRVESSTMSDPSRGLQRAALGDECLAEVSEGEERENTTPTTTTLDPRNEPEEEEEEMTKSVNLHRELATKRREVSHLVDEMHRLQSSINNLKEMSTCKIAQLQDMVSEKDRVIKDLAEKLLRQQDYTDLKRELRLLKTLEAGNWQSWSSKSVDIPLEADDKSDDANGNRLSPTSGDESDDRTPTPPSSSHLQQCLRLNVDRFGCETLNTLNVARSVRELLSTHSIGQRMFAKLVLGLSQGTVSELLSKPKPWDKLTEKGRDSYRKMHAWACDPRCIALLKAMLPRKQGCKPDGEDRPQQTEGTVEREESDEVVSMIEPATKDTPRTPQQAPSQTMGYSDAEKTPCHFAELPPVMLSHLYQEELLKLIGKRIKDCQQPMEPTKQAEHEIRQTIALYHRELALATAHQCHQRGRPVEQPSCRQYGCGEPTCCVSQQPNKHAGYFSTDSMKVLSPYSTGSPLIALAPEGGQQTIPGCSEDTSPLQRMQSITNSLLVAAGQGFGAQQFAQQRPSKAVLPPITQQQFDHYSNLNTEDIVKRVKEQLSQFSISQRLFGESVLGLSQGSVSDLLARPKPWHMLTQKGREPFIRMQMFLEDEGAVHKLVASQYKIAPERLMRMGGCYGPPPPQGSNRFSPVGPSSEQMYSNPRPPQPKPPRPCSPPGSPPLSPSAGRGGGRGPFVQPSVYEMAAVTTDLDTQVVTARIKETLTVHNIGQKLFGEAVLGLSQGSVSELLSKPKPWHMLSIKGREPFIRMQLWLGDPANVDKLQAIKTERREANKRRRSSTMECEAAQPAVDFLSTSKRARLLFSEEQKEALRLAHTLDPYPSSPVVEFLSSELGLSVRTITNWFHNHRMRMKQQSKDSDMLYSNPEAVGSTFDPVRFRLLLGQRLAEMCKANNRMFPFFPLSPFDIPTTKPDGDNTLDLSISSQQYPKPDTEETRSATPTAIDLTDKPSEEPNEFAVGKSQTRISSPSLKPSLDMNFKIPTQEVDTASGTSTPDIDNIFRCSTVSKPDEEGPVDLREEKKPVSVSNSIISSGGSNRRKPAAPQWVDPGLDLSPDSDIFEDHQDDSVINGICIRQREQSSFRDSEDVFKLEQEHNIRRLERAICEQEKGWDEISDDENVC